MLSRPRLGSTRQTGINRESTSAGVWWEEVAWKELACSLEREMLRLRTLGGLTLYRGDEALTGAATQRRRLAVLALLAGFRASGLSRDKLLAYLWPESDDERARHVLNQLLYAQRRQFGEDGLFLGQKTLRLNPAVVWSDLDAFEAALDGSELPEAVSLYLGPFLDGFFLKGAPEFERWADTQRDRLARRFQSAVSTLASRSAAAGEWESAADWWRRGTSADPLDPQAALGLLQALIELGDRPAAIRHARLYEERIRSELGVAPDLAFTSTVDRIR
jgi:DNA-binding SARP family transcriptional activator